MKSKLSSKALAGARALEAEKDKYRTAGQKQIDQKILDLIYADLKNDKSFARIIHEQNVLKRGMILVPKVIDLLEVLEEARVALNKARNVEGVDILRKGELVTTVSAAKTSASDSALKDAGTSLNEIRDALVVWERDVEALTIQDRNLLGIEILDIAFDITRKKGLDFTSMVATKNLDDQMKDIEKIQIRLDKLREKLLGCEAALYRSEKTMMDWVYREKSEI